MSPKLFSPIFLTGEPEWGDYIVEVSVRPLSPAVAVTLGSDTRSPSVEEEVQLLERGRENAAVNLIGQPLGDRPAFFLSVLPRIQELRTRPCSATGYPTEEGLPSRHTRF
jgi:hypothetical protein